ncbi:phenylalanine--tRNA ligase subunit alpha [Candidatus Woesearchaeota archaeon]|nr:phenylalanine--tRNA ligase subunit alpha [Candidatus Woesearchaeota archaeon]
MRNLGESLHALERKTLPLVEKHPELHDLAAASKLQEVETMRALQWLSNKKLVTLHEEKEELVTLDTNGRRYKEQGLPERRALELLKDGSKSVPALTEAGIAPEEIDIIIGSLKKKAAIDISKEDNHLTLTLNGTGKKLLEKPSLEELFLQQEFPIPTKQLKPEELFALTSLKTRKNIIKVETKKTVRATITKAGAALLREGIDAEGGVDRLTPRMLETGSWKKKRFRPYDVSINVPRINRGRQHFINEATQYAKRIWLDMGFKEMTGTHVQTAFWDLDALFVPQDHPAREMQDTYYLKHPMKGKVTDKEAWERVKAAHEHGGDTGSKGWRTPFDEEVALRNVLRTHTTVLSARTLRTVKETGIPAKHFVIGKVYRNESLDWKHLFEFHQVDGIVIDPNANLRHLKGYLEEFYKKMGFPKVRMRPGHFPYTEPSVEPEVWHPAKKEWVEMGGAGIFRPEVTKTLIGEEIPVLAWGLGLERIIAPHYGITDIRELYQNDLKQLRRMKNFIK